MYIEKMYIKRDIHKEKEIYLVKNIYREQYTNKREKYMRKDL